MKTREEKIIEILSKIDSKLNEWEGHSGIFFNDDRVRIGRARLIYFIKSFIADAILALPLDVPSDEEMMETIWEETDVSLSLKDKEENTVAYAMYLEIIRWAIWMKEEIIKRNK
jgi:hypothetical protein